VRALVAVSTVRCGTIAKNCGVRMTRRPEKRPAERHNDLNKSFPEAEKEINYTSNVSITENAQSNFTVKCHFVLTFYPLSLVGLDLGHKTKTVLVTKRGNG
jgi:hypothetical protein